MKQAAEEYWAKNCEYEPEKPITEHLSAFATEQLTKAMPTDEEIEEFTSGKFQQTAYSGEIVAALQQGFIIGAKWMRSRYMKTDIK